jgi:hypothetical protein
MRKRSALQYGCILFVCCLSILLSGRLILSSSRYFYHEDDAHHFNRTIEMAQRYSLNPLYFNKPSLHFYLRIPFVYAVVAYERMQGRMQSIKDIRTRDPYGLAGYAYTASHPRIVALTRAISSVWSCALVALTIVAACSARLPLWSSCVAALLVALSPEVLKNSHIIGVDTLMGLLCFVTSIYALWAMRSYTRRRLTVCALLAGLCCAAKYNAAPIVIVPVTLWWLVDRGLKGFIVAIAAPLLGFLVGAPYSLISFQDFLQGISYEAWHYGVAGHDGNSAERGWPQIVFYVRWLLSDGVGVGGVVATIIGACVAWSKDRKRAILFCAFPLSYAALMVMQKTHFTRNMLVLVPYCAVACGYGLTYLAQLCRNTSWRRALIVVATGVCLIPMASASYRYLELASPRVESRDRVVRWLQYERQPSDDAAVAGTLQLPIHVFALPGVDAFNPQKQSLVSLIQSGYRYIVVPTEAAHLDAGLTEIVESIPGEPGQQRVPHNPGVSILRVMEQGTATAAARAPASIELSAAGIHLTPLCTQQTGEPYCWIGSRTTRLSFPALTEAAILEVMSPWPEQVLTIHDEQGGLVASTKLPSPGVWEHLPIPPRRGATQRTLVLTTTLIHSPQSQGVSSDRRRLGIAIR